MNAVRGFMIESMRKLLALGVNTDLCFCLGGREEYSIFREAE